MGTVIERKPGTKRKHYYAIAGAVTLVGLVFYFVFRDASSSISVEKDQLTIATVTRGEFNDYIRIIGQVMPNRIIYMDTVEGGCVEERLREEGAIVRTSDVILRLGNLLLSIGIIQSEADLAYQENGLRNTCISMEQEHLQLKQERIGLSKELAVKRRHYDQYNRPIKEQLIAQESFRLVREKYEAAQARPNAVDECIHQDNIFRESQIHSLDEDIRSIKRSLTLIRERVENLKVKAPVDGQVGNLDAQIGQSITVGEHIRQIITPDLKVQAQIDEHYVERVVPGLPADLTHDGGNHKLEVTKPYPEVKEGQFCTNLQFTSKRPENIRAGQTYHINLQLGNPVRAILVPRDGSFQITGGCWIYVVDESDKLATHRPIRVGRQDSQYYEVTEGLRPDGRVIVLGYELSGDNERLISR